MCTRGTAVREENTSKKGKRGKREKEKQRGRERREREREGEGGRDKEEESPFASVDARIPLSIYCYTRVDSGVRAKG